MESGGWAPRGSVPRLPSAARVRAGGGPASAGQPPAAQKAARPCTLVPLSRLAIAACRSSPHKGVPIKVGVSREPWCPDAYEFQHAVQLLLTQRRIAIQFCSLEQFTARKVSGASCITKGSRSKNSEKEAFAVSGSWSLPRLICGSPLEGRGQVLYLQDAVTQHFTCVLAAIALNLLVFETYFKMKEYFPSSE